MTKNHSTTIRKLHRMRSQVGTRPDREMKLRAIAVFMNSSLGFETLAKEWSTEPARRTSIAAYLCQYMRIRHPGLAPEFEKLIVDALAA